jgi:hypothetical protein
MYNNPILPTTQSTCKTYAPLWTRLKYWLPLLLTFNLSLLTIQSCGLDIEDPSPPSPPVWVEKSLPEEWPERGIDAHELGGIVLEWESDLQEDIEAFEIFRAEYYEHIDSLGEFDEIARLESKSLAGLQFIDTQVREQKRYYYLIAAQDGADNYSDFSDTVNFSLLRGIELEMMMPNGVSDTLGNQKLLSWYYDYHIEMENYCITILDGNNELLVRSVFSPTAYIVEREYWEIPDSIYLISGQIYYWRIDADADYQGFHETSAAESQWASFLYKGS